MTFHPTKLKFKYSYLRLFSNTENKYVKNQKVLSKHFDGFLQKIPYLCTSRIKPHHVLANTEKPHFIERGRFSGIFGCSVRNALWEPKYN